MVRTGHPIDPENVHDWQCRVKNRDHGASFGLTTFLKYHPFPRRRESVPSTAHFQCHAEWVPAFAGTTESGSVCVLQMTPVPTIERVLTSTSMNAEQGG